MGLEDLRAYLWSTSVSQVLLWPIGPRGLMIRYHHHPGQEKCGSMFCQGTGGISRKQMGFTNKDLPAESRICPGVQLDAKVGKSSNHNKIHCCRLMLKYDVSGQHRCSAQTSFPAFFYTARTITKFPCTSTIQNVQKPYVFLLFFA